ncbi:hypothetical protein PENTCL1PPCAC_30452 [Pristionchus entomophagus]|uniref:Uncharacterized protein n=1 Tax=Pristionchus entomophagus TaxID=358040 RepID=A0AAV5UPT5_9BILA|nr:hypothetical protein PENTCL1PPCAC_30452 [Pristionchus entomophagus]
MGDTWKDALESRVDRPIHWWRRRGCGDRRRSGRRSRRWLERYAGKCVGGAKEAVAKEGGDGLTSKDGDFGTDFSNMAKIDKEQLAAAFKLPETSFSIDEGAKGAGAGEDYYSELVTKIDEDFEVEDRDILGLPTKATTTTSQRPSTTTMTTTQRPTSSTTTVPAATSTTRATPAATTRPPQPTTAAAAMTPAPMLFPKKGEEIPMPDFEFNIDEEDYGSTFEKSIDAMPPMVEKIGVDEKIPGGTMNTTSKPVEMLIVGRNFMEASKIVPSSSTTTTRLTSIQTTTVPKQTTTTTTPQPRSIVPIVVPRAIRPMVPVATSAPLIISPSTSRPAMRRISISGGSGSTPVPKNFRKESDYYAMYYDN